MMTQPHLCETNIFSNRCHAVLLPVEEELWRLVLTFPIQTFDLDLRRSGYLLAIPHSLCVFFLRLQSFHPATMSEHKHEEVASGVSVERLPQNKLKYYNNFRIHFPAPRGSIRTAAWLLILMIQDTMAPLWLHNWLKSLFYPPFRWHTSHILFVVLSRVYLLMSRSLTLRGTEEEMVLFKCLCSWKLIRLRQYMYMFMSYYTHTHTHRYHMNVRKPLTEKK